MTAVPRVSPYQGLVPYSEQDARFFFGRDADREIITANLIASRLTVLYGASGCGKSSVLWAGVVHHLREVARRNMASQGTPEFVVVNFSSWRSDPATALGAGIEDAIRLALPDTPGAPAHAGESFGQVLRTWSDRLRVQFLVILDQFEEYFLYQPAEHGGDRFAAEFTQAVTDPALRANFLISIRDDAITRLDRFKGQIPGLFDNYLRLHHLDLEGARAAIEQPVAEYNRCCRPGEEPFRIEPALVKEILSEVRAGQVLLPGRGRGTPRTSGASGDSSLRIETPYLQLVLNRLWDAEVADGSHVLRLDTLRHLGGAQRIVRTHLDTTMHALGFLDRAAAARILQQLVTPTGTKIAHSVADLQFYTGLPRARIERVVRRLASPEIRILRPVDPAVGEADGTRYEIFHDVLAAPVLDWGRRLGWRVAVKTAKYAAAIALPIAILWGWSATVQRRRLERQSQARALAAAATRNLGVDAELSLLLAIEAAEQTYLSEEPVMPEAEQALHQALEAMRLQLTVAGHGDRVYGVALDPSVSRLATAGDDTVRVWDAASGERLLALRHPGPVHAVAFSPDGQLIATGGQAGVRTWNAYTGAPGRPLAGHPGDVWDVAFSRDGAQIAAGGRDGATRVWDVATGAQTVVCGKPNVSVWAVAFSPEGRRLASATDDDTARVCDVRTGALVAKLGGHTGEVYGVAWADTLLATASRDFSAKLWDTRTFHERVTLSGHTSTVMGVALSRAGARAATTSADGTVRVWDAATGREVLNLTGHRKAAIGVTFSGNDSVLATASWDGTARLWDVSPAGEVPTLIGHANAVSAVAFGPSGRTILTGSESGVARLWDATSGRSLKQLRPDGGSVPLTAVAFAPRGTRLAVAGGASVSIYRDSSDASPLKLTGHHGTVHRIAFSPDGKQLATASADSTVMLWDPETGQPRDTLRNHTDGVGTVAFSPDGSELVTGGDDGTARVWDAATGSEIASLPHGDGVTGVAFSPDGQRLATSCRDWAVRIWERDGTAWRLSRTLTGHVGSVADVAFRPDGKRLASVGNDGTTKEWDAASGAELMTFTGHEGPVLSVAYSPDGSRLATAGRDHTVRIYLTRIEDLINRARARVTRPLTKEECKLYVPGRECPSRTVQLIVAGHDRARHRDFGGAVVAFQQAVRLDRTIDLPSLETEARRLTTASLVTTGERIARRGEVREAIREYDQAERLDSALHIPGWALNNVCWFGSLYDQAADVMRFCERSVADDTTDGSMRDSRGVARVLTGDTLRAIADFEAFIRSKSASVEQAAQRRRWVAALRARQRPWTKAEFLELRNQ